MNDLNRINIILEQCENLLIIEFDIEGAEFCETVINWFDDSTTGTKCRERDEMVTVWLWKKRIQSTEICVDHKRIEFQ